MSFFYRLHTKNSISTHTKLGWRESRHSINPYALSREFDYSLFTEIPMAPPWPHCKVIHGPLTNPHYMDCVHVFKSTGEVEMPEIWTEAYYLIVSERVKDIILSFDDVAHEAKRTQVIDRHGKPITDKPFWHINIRRYLEIEQIPAEPYGFNTLGFTPTGLEEKFLPTLRDTPELLDKVATLPIWRLQQDSTIYYLSQALFDVLSQAGVTGLVPQKNARAKAPESYTRFPK
jgi:hypothetical protein